MKNLKGHVKITLTDAETGLVAQTVEGDNIITDAVADILKYNLLGSTDASKILNDTHGGITDSIWHRWFGGIVCYENQHENLDASDYFMPSKDDNPVIAHAGQTGIDPDHDDDNTRGEPVTSANIRTSNGIKMVFRWTQNYGNGIIRSLSLCHNDVGCYGNGVESYHFKNTFTPWEQIQCAGLVNVPQNPRAAGNAFVQYDENHTLFFFMGADTWYDAGQTVSEQTEITIYVRRLPYNKCGLFDLTIGTTETTDERKFTVQTSIGFWYNPAYYFDPNSKYLYLFETKFITIDANTREWSRNTVNYCVIDCESETEVDSGEIVSNADDLAFLEISSDASLGDRMKYSHHVIHENVLIDGDYVYLPLGNSVTVPGHGYDTTQNFVGFKKINMSDQTEQESIVFSDPDVVLSNYFAAVKQGGLVAGFGYVMNGSNIYPCSNVPMDAGNTSNYGKDNICINELADFPVVYATRRPATEGNPDKQRYIFASKLLNTSKFDLPTAVQKLPNQVLTIEYSIVEQSPES